MTHDSKAGRHQPRIRSRSILPRSSGFCVSAQLFDITEWFISEHFLDSCFILGHLCGTLTDESDKKRQSTAVARNERGHWLPGQSPHPGGRPKIAAEVKVLAGQHTAAAINTLAEIMNNPVAEHRDRIAAARELLDRSCGKPGPVDEAGLVRDEMQRLSVQVLQVIADRPRTLELDAPDEPEEIE